MLSFNDDYEICRNVLNLSKVLLPKDLRNSKNKMEDILSNKWDSYFDGYSDFKLFKKIMKKINSVDGALLCSQFL